MTWTCAKCAVKALSLVIDDSSTYDEPMESSAVATQVRMLEISDGEKRRLVKMKLQPFSNTANLWADLADSEETEG